jgi:hypothetical protein
LFFFFFFFFVRVQLWLYQRVYTLLPSFLSRFPLSLTGGGGSGACHRRCHPLPLSASSLFSPPLFLIFNFWMSILIYDEMGLN